MARPIKSLHADAQVVRELQRRARPAPCASRSGRSIILLRTKGVSGAAILAKIKRARAALDKAQAA
jgi:hypothetical protein